MSNSKLMMEAALAVGRWLKTHDLPGGVELVLRFPTDRDAYAARCYLKADLRVDLHFAPDDAEDRQAMGGINLNFEGPPK